MTNRFAIFFGLFIVAVLVADQVFGWGWTLFLAKRFVDLIHWVAFWR